MKHANLTADDVRAAVREAWSEAEFQRQVISLARSRGWRVAHFRKVRVQRKGGSTYYETPVAADGAGFADLILARGPVLIAAELKVKRNRPTPAQLAWLDAFRQAGVLTFLWHPRDWESIVEELSQ